MAERAVEDLPKLTAAGLANLLGLCALAGVWHEPLFSSALSGPVLTQLCVHPHRHPLLCGSGLTLRRPPAAGSSLRTSCACCTMSTSQPRCPAR